MTPISKCRCCKSGHLKRFLSLGEISVTNFTDVPDTGLSVPLNLLFCLDCHLLQLEHTTPPEILYGDTYWYMSGINQTMRDELTNIIENTQKFARLSSGDYVVDIGCNDGTLLDLYTVKDIQKVGFDPAKNLSKISQPKMNHLFVNFFSASDFIAKFPDKKAKAITAISMFYDLEDPNVFIEDIKKILDPEGVFVIQQNYLGSMLTQNAYDNICHEHLEYYSLDSLENLLNRHGLEVFDVEERSINGGSFRTYVHYKGGPHSISDHVSDLKKKEQAQQLTEYKTYEAFADRVKLLAANLHSLIVDITSKGEKVYIYGASTRGNTLLQYANLTYPLITGAAERNPIKWGKRTIKTAIPILSEEEVRAQKPAYFLALPWFFKNEFLEREQNYLAAGGKIIFPLPSLEVVDFNSLPKTPTN